jgi:hypothetical protein
VGQYRRAGPVAAVLLSAGLSTFVRNHAREALACDFFVAVTASFQLLYEFLGLRYAYEAGFDVRKGAAIWQQFAAKYGQGDRFTNFFFGDHSLAAARLANLQREIAYNYSSRPAKMPSSAP